MGKQEDAVRFVEVYCGYRVGSDGTVWSSRPRNGRGERTAWRQLKQKVTLSGYREVGLIVDGKSRSFRVSRLVAAAFIPNPLGKREVNHLDGRKWNNAIANLEWATRSENELHAFRTGLKSAVAGQDRHNARLRATDVAIIRSRLASGHQVGVLAREFGVHQTTISDIKLGRSWKSPGQEVSHRT